MSRLVVTFLAVVFLIGSCTDGPEISERMIMMRGDAIGIDFKNTVTDGPKHNALVYETFYMGGGVATGDINNDGLPDLFFAGNQVEDELYLNKGDFKFERITESAGIVQDGNWSTAVTMVDINNDGWLDIYVCRSLYDDEPMRRRNLLYINQKNNTFKEEAAKYGLDDIWRTQEAVFFDYDADGDQDLLLVNQPPNPGPISPLKGVDYISPELGVRFMRNDNMRYVEVTGDVGIAHPGYGLSASVADVNNDGWLDVFIAHDYNSPDRLYLNDGNGAFKDVSRDAMKQISFFSMGTDIADVNNDGEMDIVSLDMVSDDPYRNKANMGGMEPEAFWDVVASGGNYQYMYNALHLNQGYNDDVPLYGNIGLIAGIAKTDWSWSPIFADFDNDGHQDLFVSNGIKRDLRYTDALNKLDAKLLQTMKEKGVGQEEIMNHVDAKSLLEEYPSSPLSNFMFRNTGNVKFDDVTGAWGMDQPTFSTGAVVADLDQDGDLDLVVSNLDAAPYVFKNELSKNSSVRFNLLDKTGSSVTQGARVELYHDGSDKPLINDVRTNRGFYSASESTVHFGLGGIEGIDSVRVFWSPTEYSVHRDISKGQLHDIAKADADIMTLVRRGNKGSKIEERAESLGVAIGHKRDEFDDYDVQVLLPYEIGVDDRPFAVADFNGDGLDDIVSGSTGEDPLSVYLQSASGKMQPVKQTSMRKGKVKSTHLAAGDIDEDGDIDLYVSVGGNAHKPGSEQYRNYFLINDGRGRFTQKMDMSIERPVSDSHADLVDYDGDGDLDVFVYGRHEPWHYPYPASSHVLQNNSTSGNISFTDVTTTVAPDFDELGLVTATAWANVDDDPDQELVIVGDWMPITIFDWSGSEYVKRTVDKTVGWWRSVHATDYNNDGIDDLILGNIGDNAKYKTEADRQFHVYFDDMNDNGKSDIILSYEKYDKEYPVRGKSCSSQQMPELKDKIQTYDAFAGLSVDGVYGERLSRANKLSADDFSSLLLTGDGSGGFEIKSLPYMLQIAPINDIHDLGQGEYLAVGNMQYMEVETPNIDASYGQIFSINTAGEVELKEADFNSLFSKQVNKVEAIKIDGRTLLIYHPIFGRMRLIQQP